MKNRGETRRHYRGRRRGGRRQAIATSAATPSPSTPSAPPSVRQTVARPPRGGAPLPPAPVAGISHRQVLHDIRTISIIGGFILVMLFALFLAWR